MAHSGKRHLGRTGSKLFEFYPQPVREDSTPGEFCRETVSQGYEFPRSPDYRYYFGRAAVEINQQPAAFMYCFDTWRFPRAALAIFNK